MSIGQVAGLPAVEQVEQAVVELADEDDRPAVLVLGPGREVVVRDGRALADVSEDLLDLVRLGVEDGAHEEEVGVLVGVLLVLDDVRRDRQQRRGHCRDDPGSVVAGEGHDVPSHWSSLDQSGAGECIDARAVSCCGRPHPSGLGRGCPQRVPGRRLAGARLPTVGVCRSDLPRDRLTSSGSPGSSDPARRRTHQERRVPTVQVRRRRQTAAGFLTRRERGRVASAVQRLSSRVTEEDEVSRLDADLRRARRPGLLTVPDELRTGRRAISSAAVVSLLALVLAVGCVFVLRVLWAERSTSVQDVAPGSSRSVQVVGGAATTAAVPGGVTTATGRSGAISGSVPVVPPAGAELVVHVVGQVVRPGLVRLRPGARLADAIAAAGGARPGADLAALNLARLVIDGEQIRVPRPGEAPAPGSGMAGPPGSGGGAGGRDPRLVRAHR